MAPATLKASSHGVIVSVTRAGVHEKDGLALAHVRRQDRSQQSYDPRIQFMVVPRTLLPDHVHVPGGPGPTVQANREL